MKKLLDKNIFIDCNNITKDDFDHLMNIISSFKINFIDDNLENFNYFTSYFDYENVIKLTFNVKSVCKPCIIISKEDGVSPCLLYDAQVFDKDDYVVEFKEFINYKPRNM